MKYYIECPMGERDRDQKVSEKYAEKLNSLSRIILVLFKLFLNFNSSWHFCKLNADSSIMSQLILS